MSTSTSPPCHSPTLLLVSFLVALLLCLSSLPVTRGQSINGDRHHLSQSASVITRHWTAAVHPDTGSSRADPAAQHRFKWHLPRADGAAEWLQRQFEQTTDPTHPRYQHWVDKDEVMQRIAPPSSISQPVLQWLAQHGVDTSATSAQVKQHGDVLEVTATVSTVEALFGVELHHHGRENSSSTVVRAKGAAASIPAALASSLRDGGLQQVYDLPPPFSHQSIQTYPPPSFAHPRQPEELHPSPLSAPHSFHPLSRGSKADCSRYPSGVQYAVPSSFVRALYNFSASQATAVAVNGQQVAAVGGALGDDALNGTVVRLLYSPTDLQLAGAQYNYTLLPQVSPQPYAQANAAAFAAQGVPGIEATLDIQALYAYAPDSYVANFLALAADEPVNFPYDVYYNIPAAQRPAVISMSITYQLDYQLGTVPQYFDDALQLLALAGVTWVISSGDYGAEGDLNPQCVSAPRYQGQRLTPTVGPLVPLFPATSPYVLSVGATDAYYGATTASSFTDLSSEGFCGACGANSQATVACQSAGVEEAVTTFKSASNSLNGGFSSGGGFSNTEPMPSYQADFVQAYLTTQCNAANGCSLPPSTYFNRSSRAYPDVAFIGVGFPLVVTGGVELGYGGTSLSAPGWAAIISRLNAISVSITGKTLGFVNPLLYYFQRQYLANPTSTLNPFNDVVIGNNICPPSGNCTNATVFNSCSGFYAAPGWDPVTGLGTPNVGHLETLLTAYLRANQAAVPGSAGTPVQAVGGTLDPLSMSLYNTQVTGLNGFLFSGFLFQAAYPYTVYGLSVLLSTGVMPTGRTSNVQLSLYAVDLTNPANVTATLVDYTGNFVVTAPFLGRVNVSTLSTNKPGLDYGFIYSVFLQTDNALLQIYALQGSGIAAGEVLAYTAGATPPRSLTSLVSPSVVLATTVLTSALPGSAIIGDPSFVGFLGQEYQVHGIDQHVYNLISSATLQLNALFVFLSAGRCPATDLPRVNDNCWSHPGSYLGSIALQLLVEGEVHVVSLVSGGADGGFEAVLVDGVDVGVDGVVVVADGQGEDVLVVRRLHSHEVVVRTPSFSFTLHNSDRFINQAIRIHTSVRQLKVQGVHGLIGQTHTRKQRKRAIPHIDGEVEDYNVRDGLTGTDFVYNQFPAEGEGKEK